VSIDRAYHNVTYLLLNPNYTHQDVSIDGADDVDPDLCLVKGGGGALLREKMVRMHLLALAPTLTGRILSRFRSSSFHDRYTSFIAASFSVFFVLPFHAGFCRKRLHSVAFNCILR
jgi:hypothetical protein